MGHDHPDVAVILHVPIGDDRALPLTIPGHVYMTALGELLAGKASDSAARQVLTETQVGIAVLAIGIARTAPAALSMLADRGMSSMAGPALDLLCTVGTPPLSPADVLRLAPIVAGCVLAPPAAPVSASAPARPVEASRAPTAPPRVAWEAMPDPYDGTRVEGETWPEFARRTANGRKPGCEAAMARWREIDAEFAQRGG